MHHEVYYTEQLLSNQTKGLRNYVYATVRMTTAAYRNTVCQ